MPRRGQPGPHSTLADISTATIGVLRRSARRTVDRECLAAARLRVDAVRADFYSHRYDEFEHAARRDGIPRDAMLAAVQAVAVQVDAPGAAISTAALNRALDQAGIPADDAAVARGIIVGNGVLTQSGND